MEYILRGVRGAPEDMKYGYSIHNDWFVRCNISKSVKIIIFCLIWAINQLSTKYDSQDTQLWLIKPYLAFVTSCL